MRYVDGVAFLLFAVLAQKPGDGKCGDKVEPGQQLFDKVENAAEHAAAAAKQAHVNGRRHRCPGQIDELAQKRNGKGSITDQIHQDANSKRRLPAFGCKRLFVLLALEQPLQQILLHGKAGKLLYLPAYGRITRPSSCTADLLIIKTPAAQQSTNGN